MTSATDAARLVAVLERLRRRAAIAMAVRYICATTAVALLIAEAMLLASPMATGPALLIGGVALAAAIAAVTAWFRAPTIRQAALVVDRRLHLKDRLGTAYQYRDATDEFSRLVVRDALSHADDVRAEAAFPLYIPGWVRFALVGACAVPLVFVTARIAVPDFRQRTSSGESSAPGALSIPSSAGSRDGTPASPDAAVAAIAAGASRASDAPPASPSPQADAGSPQSRQTAENTGPSPTRTPGGAAENGGTRLTDDAASDSGRTMRAPQTTVTEAAGTGRGNGIGGSPQTTQSGGLTGEPGSDAASAGARRVAEPSRDAAYRSAWSTSQRAIAQEHIPSGLRDYVRQYFLAIRPAEPR